MRVRPFRYQWCWHWGAALCSSAIALLWSQVGWSAERLYFSYGLIQRSVPIESLERYAADGVIDSRLGRYTRYLSDRQMTQLRPALTTKAEVSHVAIAQFLYTPQGEALLNRLGDVVQSESGQPGFFALRAALILAADSEEGLTLLNVLKAFPIDGIRVDLVAGLEFTTELQRTVSQTNAAVKLIQQRSQQEAQQFPILGAASLPDPTQPGPYEWQVYSEVLVDETRQKRRVPVDYYVPDRSGETTVYPLVVISHGLGNDRNSYAYLAEHLASYGFLVLVPEHPGSSSDQIAALVNGYADQVTDPQEFTNRPLDIQFVLDDFAQRQSAAPFQPGAIDPNRVLVIGQSFGGYTALAVAGAQVNLGTLQRECQNGLEEALNLSLLLQCQASIQSLAVTDLRDDRIQAAIAINPVGSAIFGAVGFGQIEIPLLVLSGNADTIAPALPEQIRPFTWLHQSPATYLALVEGSTHFSTIGSSPGDVVSLPPPVIGPDPGLAQQYVKALSLSFAYVHLMGNADYAPLLTSAYSQSLSQSPLSLRLIQSLTPADLKVALSGAGSAAEGDKAGK